MDAPLSIVISGVSVFLLSAIYYIVLSPGEARAIGPVPPDRGGQPAPSKALLELVRSVLVVAVIAGLARACRPHAVGATVLLGLVLRTGFPLMLLNGSVVWDKLPTATALLHAGDWLLKLLVISAIVGLWL